MERTCKKCGETKPIEEFVKAPTCKYGRSHVCLECSHKYGKEHYEKIKVLHPRPKITEKTCRKCGKLLPLTDEYFFYKIYKQKRADGTITKYKYFRYVCKNCNSAIHKEKHQRKRCVELNCDITEYDQSWKRAMAFKKIKYYELIDVPGSMRSNILRACRLYNRYVSPSEYKDLVKRNLKKKWKRQRKYDYGDTEKVTSSMCNQKSMQFITDARIANSLRMPVRDVPKKIIKQKRILIMLKREAGLTHSTKK